MKPTHFLLLMIGLLLAGCAKKANDDAARAGEKASAASGEHQGMQMDGMMENTTTMMQGHMDSMMRMSPGQMSQMMATHDRMTSQMMDRMGSEMRGMKMSGDAKWNALTDSVKRDLAVLPGLSGQALSARMKEHAGRVRRLMMMHERMMTGMH